MTRLFDLHRKIPQHDGMRVRVVKGRGETGAATHNNKQKLRLSVCSTSGKVCSTFCTCIRQLLCLYVCARALICVLGSVSVCVWLFAALQGKTNPLALTNLISEKQKTKTKTHITTKTSTDVLLLFLSIANHIKKMYIPYLQNKKQNKQTKIQILYANERSGNSRFEICCLLRFAFTHCQLLCEKTLDHSLSLSLVPTATIMRAVILRSNAAMETARI